MTDTASSRKEGGKLGKNTANRRRTISNPRSAPPGGRGKFLSKQFGDLEHTTTPLGALRRKSLAG